MICVFCLIFKTTTFRLLLLLLRYFRSVAYGVVWPAISHCVRPIWQHAVPLIGLRHPAGGRMIDGAPTGRAVRVNTT